MQTTPAGDRGVLITMPEASPAELRAMARAIRAEATVIGYDSIFVIGTAGVPAGWPGGVSPPPDDAPNHHRITVSFRDDYAPDLTIPHEELFANLPVLTVRFLGFRPGFAYMDGWPERWQMPRRPTSRNRVPRGSFAVAGAFAGFYAVDSPGGWNLLGRTAAPLWDPRRDPPNLLAPGDTVEIIPTMDEVELPPLDETPPEPRGEPIADVIAPGQLTTIAGPADVKRLEHGLPTGGPFDPGLAAVANRTAGNPDGAPLLECVLVGPRLRLRKRLRVAWNDRLLEGEEIDVGRIDGGLRGYLAIEGGIDERRPKYAEKPTIVRAKDVLFTMNEANDQRSTKNEARRTDPHVITVALGPHPSNFVTSDWLVTPQLDRVGVRLQPLQKIDQDIPADLPSCGAQFGTVQWHPDGTLVALGPDHPVTGGYLQPVTVLTSELWKLAQLAPGELVRLEVRGVPE